MKRTDINNLKQMPPDELRKSLKQTVSDLAAKQFEAMTGKLKNAWEVRELRRKIARLETFIKQQTK